MVLLGIDHPSNRPFVFVVISTSTKYLSTLSISQNWYGFGSGGRLVSRWLRLSAEKPTEISSCQNMSRETKAEGRDEGSATAHVPHTTSYKATTVSSATNNSPPNPGRRHTMVRATLLQFLLCKGDFSEYFVQHMARLLGLDRTGPLMTTCSHVYHGNMVLYWAPKKWTNGVRKVMRNLLISARWKTWVWTLNVEHLVLGSDGNGNEAMVVTLRMPVSHEDVHDSLPSTSVRLVVFGNNRQ